SSFCERDESSLGGAMFGRTSTEAVTPMRSTPHPGAYLALRRTTGRLGARRMRRLLEPLLLVAALVPLWVAMPAAAQEVGLSPTLASIKRTITVRLGYRDSSLPFSYLDAANRPIGYSLELCKAIIEEIGSEFDIANLKIDYVKVTPETRIPAVL